MPITVKNGQCRSPHAVYIYTLPYTPCADFRAQGVEGMRTSHIPWGIYTLHCLKTVTWKVAKFRSVKNKAYRVNAFFRIVVAITASAMAFPSATRYGFANLMINCTTCKHSTNYLTIGCVNIRDKNKHLRRISCINHAHKPCGGRKIRRNEKF